MCSCCVRQPMAATPPLILSLCEGNDNLCLKGTHPWPSFHPGLGMWCWGLLPQVAVPGGVPGVLAPGRKERIVLCVMTVCEYTFHAPSWQDVTSTSLDLVFLYKNRKFWCTAILAA